jgi:hypothetical protein
VIARPGDCCICIKQILPDGAHGDRSREGTVPTWT